MRTYFVYILECSDGSFYTGVTSDIDSRFEAHQAGLLRNAYTHKRRPVRLVYLDETDDVGAAIFREKQIKGWSRKKKLALIHNQDHLLPELSIRRTQQKPSYRRKSKLSW